MVPSNPNYPMASLPLSLCPALSQRLKLSQKMLSSPQTVPVVAVLQSLLVHVPHSAPKRILAVGGQTFRDTLVVSLLLAQQLPSHSTPLRNE